MPPLPAHELPGLWYDPERNRYFPLSSRPKAAIIPTYTAPEAQGEGPSRKRRKVQSGNTSGLSTFSTTAGGIKIAPNGAARRRGLQ